MLDYARALLNSVLVKVAQVTRWHLSFNGPSMRLEVGFGPPELAFSPRQGLKCLVAH
jgi:hypothetical protein